ncbi:hypothetical protein EON67_09325 [archaeon]|nr:MAG: hypothetical protein EON67_09325 [archaeon]
MSLLLTLGVAALALLALGGVLLMSLVLAIKYCTPLAAQAKAMEPVWPHYPAIPEETTRSAFAYVLPAPVACVVCGRVELDTR